MATKEPKEKKKSAGAPPGAKPPKDAKKKKGGEQKVARGPHAGSGKPVPPPRLKAYYEQTVRPKLTEQFGLKNPHQLPTLTKIVLNVGAGEAIKQPKFLDNIVRSWRRSPGSSRCAARRRSRSPTSVCAKARRSARRDVARCADVGVYGPLRDGRAAAGS
jgi:large subunit ribosomal protein L5